MCVVPIHVELDLEEAIDIPPKNAFLALDAARLGERTCNRVVLAREATYDHIDRRNAPLSGFDLVHDSIDVLIDDGILAKVGCIAARCELAPLRFLESAIFSASVI